MKKIISLGLLASALSLTACGTGVVVASATAGGSIVYDHRDFSTQIDDKTIVYKVKQQYVNNKAIMNDAHISVTSFNHVVLLVGQAPNAGVRSEAVKIAQSTPKVRRVFNRIKIAPHATIKQATNDTWITTKVKADMLAEKGLQSTQIKVVTEKRTTYLMGLVSRKQAGIATNVARHVSGVNKVVKLFEYTH